MPKVTEIASLDAFDAAIASSPAVVVHYWAPWCEPCTFMDEVFRELAAGAPASAAFLRCAVAQVEAEEVPDVSEKMEVAAVPFFTLHRDGVKVDVVEGAEPVQLSEKVRKLLGQPLTAPPSVPNGTPLTNGAPHNGLPVNGGPAQSAAAAASPFTAQAAKDIGGGDLTARLERLTRSSPVVLFMKGSPDAPRCGFSARVVSTLRGMDVPFSHFDILEDQAVREGMKKFSDWPTFPQLYAGGELVGGCDIIAAMADSGDLKPALDSAITAAQSAGDQSVHGDSSASVSVRASSGAEAGPSDGATASADGGGHAANGLDEALQKRLEALIVAHPVMLFMKGTPDAPRCGFSRKVATALQATEHPFGFFDILSDEAVRQGIKEYGQWPTFPQVWVRGELLGGCDIVETLDAEGSLAASIDDMLAA